MIVAGAAARMPSEVVTVDPSRRELSALVGGSGVPALLVEIPSTRILAGSPQAFRQLRAAPADVIGRRALDFALDPRPDALALLADGGIAGIEAWRRWRLPDGSVVRVHFWLRAVERTPPVRHALAVLWPTAAPNLGELAATDDSGVRAVFGTISADLLIERVSADADLLPHKAASLVGRSFLGLLDPTSVPDTLVALARVLRERTGICVTVRVAGTATAGPASLSIFPVTPGPGFLFALVFPHEGASRGTEPAAPERALIDILDGLSALSGSAVLAFLDHARLPGWDTLTPREADIAARSLAGDRGPTIARRLTLSETTVRNTLSAVYRKLRVGSQQELVELFRRTARRMLEAGDPSA